METYEVEVAASNKIKKSFDTLAEVARFLKNCRGVCSVANKKTELYYGDPVEVADRICCKLEIGDYRQENL